MPNDPSTAIVLVPDQVLTAAQVRARVNRIHEVMEAVMKKDVHFGVIPGTKKPSLYKAGAEVLAATFRLALVPHAEDLSVVTPAGEVLIARYRVTVGSTDSVSGIPLGAAMGECSSDEEKYRWREAVCDEEWSATPDDRRRTKWKKVWNEATKKKEVGSVRQIRTQAADVANTILKMAIKRAQVAVTLNVTAASDIFTQDIEDLPEEMRPAAEGEVVEGEKPAAPQAPAQKPAAPPGAKPLTIKSVKVTATSSEDAERQWTLWSVETNEDGEFITFEPDHVEACEKAMKTKTPVTLKWEARTKKGRTSRVILDVNVA
jgi:hypothetical protein